MRIQPSNEHVRCRGGICRQSFAIHGMAQDPIENWLAISNGSKGRNSRLAFQETPRDWETRVVGTTIVCAEFRMPM